MKIVTRLRFTDERSFYCTYRKHLFKPSALSGPRIKRWGRKTKRLAGPNTSNPLQRPYPLCL